MSRGLRALTTLVGVAVVATTFTAGQALTRRAAADVVDTPPAGWSVSSAYRYVNQIPSSARWNVGDPWVRVTLTVPAGVDWFVAGGVQVYPRHGYATFDVNARNYPNAVPFEVDLPNGDLWDSEVLPAVAEGTALSITSVSSRAVSNGDMVRVSGTLLADGAPVEGQRVSLIHRHFRMCSDLEWHVCDDTTELLGRATTTPAGTWTTRIPVRWRTEIDAVTCEYAAMCPRDDRTPGFASGPTVYARWKPTLDGPSHLRAQQATDFRVTAPLTTPVDPGATADVQAFRKGTWVTVGAATLEPLSPLTLGARVSISLPPAQRLRLRVRMPLTTTTYPVGPGDHIIKVGTGASTARVVTVSK